MSLQNTPQPAWRKLASLILVNGQMAQSPTRHRLVNTWLTYYAGNFLPAALYQDILQAILAVLAQISAQASDGEIERAASIKIYLQDNSTSQAATAPSKQFPKQAEDCDPQPEIQISGHHAVGSWGYFLVERTQCLQENTGRSIFLQVEVYLYSETGSV